ncbi:hypothetical protein [Streptomyces canus]|uniref:hypothetical protein n=1 Tax=Streptomyces canus TaxID=58343 RepID=UPI003716E81A
MEPPCLLQLTPWERIAVEAKAAQDPNRQPDLALGVHAQCALHGEQPGRSSGMARQG